LPNTDLPTPPAAVPDGAWTSGIGTQAALNATPPKRRSPKVKGLGVLAFVVALWVGGTLTHQDPSVSTTTAGVDCVNADTVKAQWGDVGSSVNAVNADIRTGDRQGASAELLLVGTKLDRLADTVAGDPEFVRHLAAAAADQREAAAALDEGNFSAVVGDMSAFNAEMIAARTAAQSSQLPAC
jgi:hypothetical protein